MGWETTTKDFLFLFKKRRKIQREFGIYFKQEVIFPLNFVTDTLFM